MTENFKESIVTGDLNESIMMGDLNESIMMDKTVLPAGHNTWCDVIFT